MKFFMSLATMFGFLGSIHAASPVEGPAQFKGRWSGIGVYQRSGIKTNCPVFHLSFDGSNYLMSFLGGSRQCETHNETFASVAMAYNNGKLYYDGKVVGSITGNVLESKFSMPEGNGHVRHWRMSMRKEGQTIVYEESRTMDDEVTPLISFAGLLSPEE